MGGHDGVRKCQAARLWEPEDRGTALAPRSRGCAGSSRGDRRRHRRAATAGASTYQAGESAIEILSVSAGAWTSRVLVAFHLTIAAAALAVALAAEPWAGQA